MESTNDSPESAASLGEMPLELALHTIYLLSTWTEMTSYSQYERLTYHLGTSGSDIPPKGCSGSPKGPITNS